MTLLELLVVVAILAVLATVAIQSTTDIGNQTRYEVTQKSLAAFRDSVLGPANQTSPDGIPMVTGFIADMGRPPRSRALVPNPDLAYPVYDLAELYSENLPSGLQSYALHVPAVTNLATAGSVVLTGTFGVGAANSFMFTTFSGVAPRVPAGWRGPYVRKASTELSLVDGWSKILASRLKFGTSEFELDDWPTMLLGFRTNPSTQPFRFRENNDYTAVLDANRDVVGVFTQSGFDGAPVGSDAYSGRFYSTITANDYRVPVNVSVTVATANTLSTNAFVVVMMYGPNPEVASDSRPIRVWAQQQPFTTYSIQFPFEGAYAPTIGTRMFRAVLRTSTGNYVYGRSVYFPIRPGVQNINIPLP
jgi:hypothetical protein